MMTRSRIAAAFAAMLWAGALAACGGPDHPAPHGATEPPANKPDAHKPEGDKPPEGGALACRLPAPKKSDDACATDADCGVSDPCHAKACVAKARSHPPAADTVCTRSLECHSADVNRCGCFEGKCALVPPKG